VLGTGRHIALAAVLRARSAVNLRYEEFLIAQIMESPGLCGIAPSWVAFALAAEHMGPSAVRITR
jgi:hypothetical protein